MKRSLLFFGGLFATIAVTAAVGQWLVPQRSLPVVHGLEVDATPTATAGPVVAAAPTSTPTPMPTAEPSTADSGVPSQSASAGDTLHPTLNWVNVYSQNSQFNGVPLPVGSVVSAYDPDGVLAGQFTVQREGAYGLMAVYLDDPLTPIDEGAKVGDTLTFAIDGIPAQIVGPDAPVVTGNGALLQIDLKASGAPVS